MVKCELWRRWRINAERESLEERLYVKQPDGTIWRSEWRKTGTAFYQLWRAATWFGVAEVEPGAKLVGRYKLPPKGRAALVRAAPLERIARP